MLLIELSEREQNFNTDILLENYNVKNTTHYLRISMFHSAFFNSIIDKHQHMHFFIQHYISLEC